MSADQEWALRLGMDRTRRELVAEDDVLARVEVERRLELEARRGFGQAVREARAQGHNWEQIVRHVPGLGPANSDDGAEKLFGLVSVPGSRFGADPVSWRCSDCDGLVLDRGPDAGHPVDTEPGHRENCGRLAAEVNQYVAGLDVESRLATGLAGKVADQAPETEAWARPIELDGPGLDLW